jgi:heat shock protein HslJ
MRTLLLSLILLGGCVAASSGRPAPGIEWRASDINGVPVASNTQVTLRLDGGNASGNAGCNTYSGTYEILSGERMRIGPLGVTRKACAPEVMAQEQRVLSILGQVRGYNSYSDGSFSLIAPDGSAIRFRR